MDSKDRGKRVGLVSKLRSLILAAAVLSACSVPAAVIARQGDLKRVERDSPDVKSASELLFEMMKGSDSR